MATFEFRPSLLLCYPYLCVPIRERMEETSVQHTWCMTNFGDEGTAKLGKWYGGLLGFYFAKREDAVQFMLAWG